MKTLVLQFCTLLLGCGYLLAQQHDGSLDWRTVLDWLPTDTQTLIVAAQPFVIPAQEPDVDSGGPSPVDFLGLYALGRLGEFPALYQALTGHTVKFALSGVREFQSFSGLGLGPYDGCAVIVFSEPLGASFSSAASGLPKENWDGATVLHLSTERQGSLRSAPERLNLFVIELGSNILAAATDRDSLRYVLERRNGHQTDRALPDALPEWRVVDVTAAAWAMRHYKHTNDGRTREGVLSLGYKEELNDQEAVGVVYNAQPVGRTQKVYCLSHNQQAGELARQRWELKEEGLVTPRVSRRFDGVVEVVVPTPSAQASGVFDLLLLTSLGYAIAI